MGSGRAHIRDVARAAGVSVGTVSNVLNGRTTVQPELAERVRAVVRELGYVPNSHAQQLKSKANKSLGLLVLSEYNAFFNALAVAAEDTADEAGYSLLLGASSQRADREAKYLKLFESQRVGAVMLAPVDGITPEMRALQARGTPIVVLGAEAADEFCSVQSDSDRGGYVAAQHLIAQGRTSILVAGGPIHQIRGRVNGAARAVGEAEGVRMDYLSTATQSIDEGRRVGAHVLSLPRDRRPDAIFAANDFLAIGIMHQITLDGSIRIPEDLSLIGHDDIEFAATSQVPLSTIRQPIETMAVAAVELALAEIGASTTHQHRKLVFPPQLVIRETSLPASRQV